MSVGAAKSLLMNPSGGSGGYSFSVSSGQGSFSGSTFNAPAFPQHSRIVISDSRGTSWTASVYTYQENLQVGGAYHFCAIIGDGRLKCWGYNAQGQLGLEDASNRGDNAGEMAALPDVQLGSGRTALSVAAGKYFTCAILDNLRVKCWGDGASGENGLEIGTPWGTSPGQMGDGLPYVDLGSSRLALAISSNGHHTCVVLDDLKIKCWGEGAMGVLGLGDPNPRGHTPGTMGDALPEVDLGTMAAPRELSVGKYHACVLSVAYELKCWGGNSAGQLLVGDVLDRGDAPSEMGDNLPFAQLGTGRTARRIFSGGWASCAILDDGSLKCWGRNGSGQLGLENLATYGTTLATIGDNLPVVNVGSGVSVAEVVLAGHTVTNSTCALMTDGRVKCWGLNSSGELGIQSTTQHGHAASTMGDFLPFLSFGAGGITPIAIMGSGHTTLGRAFCARFTGDRFKCWGNGSEGQTGRDSAANYGFGATHMGDDLAFIAF